MKRPLVLLVFVLFLGKVSAQDTVFVTLTSRYCLPCYGHIYSFIQNNETPGVIVGLALIDTSKQAGFNDKMFARHILTFCDTVIYIDSHRPGNSLEPIPGTANRFYDQFLTRPSPVVLIKSTGKVTVFPVQQVSKNNRLNEKIKRAILSLPEVD